MNKVTSQHKDQTSQDNYLTSDGRNMPPYTIDKIILCNLHSINQMEKN